MEMFECIHGRTVDAGGQPLPECIADVENLAVPDNGDERGEALRSLVDGPLCVPFDVLHGKTEQLVGRPVWTHEFARPLFDNLVREAASQQHPADLEAHVIGSMDQMMGDRPVIIARPS